MEVINLDTIRAAAYCRYSSDNQREESITAQIHAIKEYCLKKGYIISKVYCDEAKSATTDQRPNFQELITDSELDLFDVVIVHKLDRFARNRYDSAFYKRKLRINNIRLESVLEQLDDSPESIILESVLEGMAEYYSKNLAREVRKGLRENADKAIHNGGRPLYGLKVNPETRKYEIDENRYKAVVMYFEGVAAGIPLARIAKQINDAGYRTFTGQKFKVTSFDTWAYNRKYKGDYVWDVSSKKNAEGKRNSHSRKPIEEQTIIPNAIPPIISKELWEKVNKLMEVRRHKGGQMKAKTIYLLSGKVFCEYCKSTVVGESYKSRNNFYSYYKCSGKCGNRNVPKEKLEDIVISQLNNLCFTPEAMKSIAKKVQNLYAERYRSINSEIEPIKKEICILEDKINNWIDAIGEGLLDKTILADKIIELA